MKLSLISALLIPLAFAGVVPSGSIARDELVGPQSGLQGNVKRQQQTTFNVIVGSSTGARSYFPNAITGANVGDLVNFTLAEGSTSHTITQAADDGQSCHSLATGVNHFFDPAKASTINFIQPVEFVAPFHAFSNVVGDCDAGMTFSVNAS